MTQLIPRSVLFKDPARAMPALSPDGRLLSFLARADDVRTLWVGSLDGRDAKPVLHDRDVLVYTWAADSRTLIYLQDGDGDENWHLHAVDITDGSTRDLTPYDGVQARIIHKSRRHPEELLVALNLADRALHDVYRLHLPSGRLRLVDRHPGLAAGLNSWVADHDLNVRASTWALPDGSVQVRVRDEPGGPWRTLLTFDLTDSLMSDAQGFSADGRRLLVRSSQGARTRRLVWVELATGEQHVVAEDPESDVTWAIQDPRTWEPQVVAFLKDRHDYRILDESVVADLETLRSAHHGDFALISRDNADTTWIVGYFADDVPSADAPGAYMRYDRPTRTVSPLFDDEPGPGGGYDLARMRPFDFSARDGLKLHGYLTFPPGAAANEPLPTVLLVHGGPWARDTWRWHPEVQLLANRGYLVVQVNFRGSTGYGKDLLNAGDHEWAGKMHEDLVDAVGWVVARGYADAGRVAVMGGSYGGYAALVGAAFTPDLFRCAVSFCGPVNLSTMITAIPSYWIGLNRQLRARVGDPERDADLLWSRSPLSRVGDIRVPVMVVHGANDTRVTQTESEQIVAELRRLELPCEYLLLEDEGHIITKPANIQAFWARVERFLSEHLGGRCEE